MDAPVDSMTEPDCSPADCPARMVTLPLADSASGEDSCAGPEIPFLLLPLSRETLPPAKAAAADAPPRKCTDPALPEALSPPKSSILPP
eukprot:scaffold1533_cov254-Pinguiococcus_pyrenoidosus.AAC.1